jgi:hypothetical protein
MRSCHAYTGWRFKPPCNTSVRQVIKNTRSKIDTSHFQLGSIRLARQILWAKWLKTVCPKFQETLLMNQVQHSTSTSSTTVLLPNYHNCGTIEIEQDWNPSTSVALNSSTLATVQSDSIVEVSQRTLVCLEEHWVLFFNRTRFVQIVSINWYYQPFGKIYSRGINAKNIAFVMAIQLPSTGTSTATNAAKKLGTGVK